MAGRVLGIVTMAAVLAGCGEQGNELREATERRRAAEARDDSAAADSPPSTPERLPAFVLGDSTPGAAPAESASTAPAADSAAAPAPAPLPGWTAGRTAVRRRPAGVATLREVRAAPNQGFDRFVVVFGADPVPGYRVEHVDRPVCRRGSGEAAEVAGAGWLAITLHDSRAHTDDGRATVQQRERALSLPVLREWEFTCDFEAEVQIVLGLASPHRYRVLELANPSRLVVDVQH